MVERSGLCRKGSSARIQDHISFSNSKNVVQTRINVFAMNCFLVFIFGKKSEDLLRLKITFSRFDFKFLLVKFIFFGKNAGQLPDPR